VIRDHANFAWRVSLVTRAISNARYRHFQANSFSSRPNCLTMHGRCLERRKAVQGKKETEEIGRVSRFFPSRATGYVPFGESAPSIDRFTRARWSLIHRGFAISDHRPLPRGSRIHVISRNLMQKKMTRLIRDKRKTTILDPLMIIHARQIKSK